MSCREHLLEITDTCLPSPMSNPITLWRRKATVTSDEAGTAITNYALPRFVSGPYEDQEKARCEEKITYIPSLKSICIRKLVDFPDQVPTLGSIHLPYEAPKCSGDYDSLRELIPFYGQGQNQRNDNFLKLVDPRLWAVIVQIHSGLPDDFRTYNLPLSDIHMPILQQIPQTSRFSLVTVLELCSCNELDDDSIVELRELRVLGALDLCATAVSSFGIGRLSKTLVRSPDEEHAEQRLIGPWRIRVLYLKDCMNIDDDVYRSLNDFPVLSVVGEFYIRSTVCLLHLV